MVGVMKMLVIFFSQSGHSQRACDIVQRALQRRFPGSTILRVDLARVVDVDVDTRMPWSCARFIRALPSSLSPHGTVSLSPEVAEFRPDITLICYPVWYLSPVPHLMLYLSKLPCEVVRNHPVVTISTCRNMWLMAQHILQQAIESRGGRIIAHAVLEDRGSLLASFVTTPYFFLTGRRKLKSKALARILPEFGVAEESFEALAVWASDIDPSVQGHRALYRLHPELALSEIVGRQIFKATLFAWPRIRNLSAAIQTIYLSFCVAVIVPNIILLLPLLVMLSKIPPVRNQIVRRIKEAVIWGASREGASEGAQA
jgi:hypothetical protein